MALLSKEGEFIMYQDEEGKQHVVISSADIDTVLLENQSVQAGEVITSDWFDVSKYREVTVYVKTTKTCVTSIQVTDDNVSANPDAFTLCAKDGAGTAVSLNTSATEQGLSYTFTTNAEKMRVLVRNNDTTADTPYVGLK